MFVVANDKIVRSHSCTYELKIELTRGNTRYITVHSSDDLREIEYLLSTTVEGRLFSDTIVWSVQKNGFITKRGVVCSDSDQDDV
jgi:uncharacterized membrane protein